MIPPKNSLFCHHHKKWMLKVIPPNPHNQILVRMFLISAITAGFGMVAIWIANLSGIYLDPLTTYCGAYFVTMFCHAYFENLNPFKSLLVAPILLLGFLFMSFTKYGIESNLKWLVLPILIPTWLIWQQNLSFWPSLIIIGSGSLASIVLSLTLIVIRISNLSRHNSA